MTRTHFGVAGLVASALILLQPVFATLVPRLSFEQLTDASERIVSGKITSSWAAWDSEHKYIWTHYSLAVTSTLKGSRASVVEFAEPGGSLDGVSMMIAGSVNYAQGDNMVIFLERMPNGYLRTAGWAQGKYGTDASGRLHASASAASENIDAKNPVAGSSLQTIEGLSVSELSQRVAARVRAAEERTR